MKRFGILMAFCCLVTVLQAQIEMCLPGGYEADSLVDANGDALRYRYLKPEKNKKIKKYPLVIFLHGAGEKGKDNLKQLAHGGQMFLNPVNREKYPAYVIFPQCPEGTFWVGDGRTQGVPPLIAGIKQMIDKYLAYPDVDPKRVYVLGLSMGGFGTFKMAATYPEVFAAAIPICGGIMSEELENAKGVKFRIFHGDADNVVPTVWSRMAYRQLRSMKADVEYIEYPGCGHDSWTVSFNRPDFMEWMFKQKKK